LPNAVVDVYSVDLFKSRLDNFWISQDVKYDLAAAWDLPAAVAVNRQHNQMKQSIACRYLEMFVDNEA